MDIDDSSPDVSTAGFALCDLKYKSLGGEGAIGERFEVSKPTALSP